MEVVRFPSRGGLSVRSIFVFALTVFITAILWATFSSVPTQAQATNGAWTDGDIILYDGHGFNAATDITDPTGTIPSGSKIYKSAVQTGTGTTSSKIFIIYYSSGVDPPTATSARYVEFDYSGGTLSNPQNARDITMTPQGSTDGLAGEVETSCAVGGIGWIICPVSVFLAEAMDNLFNILAGMIQVQPPILGDENNSMYVAWNVMRSIANIAFVIVFLIIIFSQLSNIAISNYGLKRLVPRLIIAAILVNVSFYIAAAAIDLSNIAGYSVQAIFNGIRENLFSVTNDNLSGANTNTWSAVTAIILAGGGAVGGVYYMATGGLYLLVPLLIGLALTVLFVVLIFAARQAIILILVIIAPIAFVANLLPNTEKWFDKWKDLFFTMLIFFPAFALVFGGSQLAGQIIIQNAGDNIVTLLFGMAVQIAPLVITPLILKLSGGLLGRIAQIANNPRKGVLDRSRGWAEKRAEHAKYQNIKRGARWYNPSSYGAGMVRRSDFRKRRLADNTEIWKQGATNRYEETSKFGDISERKERAEVDKKGIHAKHAEHLDRIKSGKSTNDKYGLYGSAVSTTASEERAEKAKNEVTEHYNNLRVRGSSVLRASSYDLEMSKVRLDTSDKAKIAYYTNQKATPGTRLNALVEEYETTKVRVEGAESRYTALVDGMKIDTRSTLNGAVQTAQSSKQQAETAQVKLQAYFDAQNRNPSTVMGKSYIELEEAKIVGEGTKAQLTEYITEARSARGTAIHAEVIKTERLKQAQSAAEARMTRVVDEYKSGAIDRTTLTAQEATLMDQIAAENVLLSAEKQGAAAATYEIQRNVTEQMTAGGPLTDSLLDIAQGVGGDTARVRAQAQAVSNKQRLDSEALDSNVKLLKSEAQNANTTIKKYSAGLVQAVINGDPDYEGRPITDERVKAALQAQAEEKNMSLFEKVRGSRKFNQDMVSEVIALNVPTFKGAGGFHMQDDPSLNIDNFASEADFNEAMRYSRIQSLANASASGLSGVKFGWLADFANDDPTRGTTLEQNIQAALTKPDGEKYLRMAYSNVHEALENDDIRASIGDREDEIRVIEAALADVFHQTPLPDPRPRI